MNKSNLTPPASKDGTDPLLEQLRKVCRTNRERNVLRLLRTESGLLTHELGEKFGCKSNNQHNVTKDLNPRLIKVGWVITKYYAGKRYKSWRWYLEPVTQALVNPIREDLRATILKHIEAANDE